MSGYLYHGTPGQHARNFMEFWGKFGKIVCCRTLGGLAGIPGSAPGEGAVFKSVADLQLPSGAPSLKRVNQFSAKWAAGWRSKLVYVDLTV